MCFHQKPLYLLWHLLSPLEIFRCHYVTTAFFQNSPPGIDLSKDTLAPLKSKPSCQHILMAFFGGKTGDISGPGRCRDHACVCSESFGNLLLFIVVPWRQYWIQHHRDISSEPEFPFMVILGKLLDLLETLFLHLSKGGQIVLWRLNCVIYKCLAYDKLSTNEYSLLLLL